jgi:penicillin-binding protein 1A
MYLASVRYEVGVFGIAQALRYFFGATNTDVSSPIAFFLIERVSNVRSKLLVEKIDQTLRGVVNAGLLDKAQASEVIEIYSHAIQCGKIEDPGCTGIARLRAAWAEA